MRWGLSGQDKLGLAGSAAFNYKAVLFGDDDHLVPPPPCVSGKFRDFWRRGVRNTRWGLHDVGVEENEEI